MVKLTYSLIVGRFELTGEYEAVPIDDPGTPGMPSQEWERPELEAAIAVLQQAESINGDELRCARKAMGLRQPALAALLEVATETVSRSARGTRRKPFRQRREWLLGQVLLALCATACTCPRTRSVWSSRAEAARSRRQPRCPRPRGMDASHFLPSLTPDPAERDGSLPLGGGLASAQARP
jgi:hypothetical protein